MSTLFMVALKERFTQKAFEAVCLKKRVKIVKHSAHAMAAGFGDGTWVQVRFSSTGKFMTAETFGGNDERRLFGAIEEPLNIRFVNEHEREFQQILDAYREARAPTGVTTLDLSSLLEHADVFEGDGKGNFKQVRKAGKLIH